MRMWHLKKIQKANSSGRVCTKPRGSTLGPEHDQQLAGHEKGKLKGFCFDTVDQIHYASELEESRTGIKGSDLKYLEQLKWCRGAQGVEDLCIF